MFTIICGNLNFIVVLLTRPRAIICIETIGRALDLVTHHMAFSNGWGD